MSELDIESPDDPRVIHSYKPFSVLAVIALLTSIASAVGTLNPQFVILPIIALILGLIACFQIGFSKNQRGGGWMALTATFLAGSFLLTGSLYANWRKDHYFDQARQFADIWLNMVRDGEIYRPHHLLREFPERLPTNADVTKYYQGLTNFPNSRKETDFQIKQYVTLEPEKSIRQFGKNMTFEYLDRHSNRTALRAEYYCMKYVLHWPAESGRPDWPILIQLKRTDHKLPIGPQWMVVDLYPYPGDASFTRQRSGVMLQD